MADTIPLELQLTGAEEEWLVRAAFGSPRGVMPSSVVGSLAAAGLGEKNSRGTLDVNDAGRQYIKVRDLPASTTNGALRTTHRRKRAIGQALYSRKDMKLPAVV